MILYLQNKKQNLFNASTIKDILLLLRYKTNEAVGLHKNPTASKCMSVVNEIEMTLLLKTWRV